MNYFFAVLVLITAFIILKFILKLTLKVFTTIFLVIAVIVTLSLMVVQPKMHKEFNFNIIERVLKFNSDGSTSIIETTTTNEVRKK